MKLIYVGRNTFERKGIELPEGVVVSVSDKAGEYLKGFKDVHEVKGEEKSLKQDFKDKFLTESGDERFKCPECGKEWDTKRQLTAHKVGAHRDR